ncbi:MAG: DEAD/DEAH box helicase family protein [Chloroflexota bacterium]|nr:DEAD/DEAH box helicase family protein [Chloroflexota bacterium]
MATATRKTRSRTTREPSLRFDQRLVLNQWLLSLFGVSTFEALADALKDPRYEGFDDENISRLHEQLAVLPSKDASLSREVLLEYDQNIVRHWRAITERRNRDGNQLYPKYFQYLALLFTEIYLDRLFRDSDLLLKALNQHVADFNLGKAGADQIEAYTAAQLNKLAFWNATGSGKTLLMHVNIRQYQHYVTKHGSARDLNRIILLTPNEGLSRQHLDEFGQSGMEAELFAKDGRGLFAAQAVEIIDINKLKDDMGVKTVAIDAFEGNNLVLVDEGHRGSSGEEWKSKRDKLCEEGFSFEYSATFGQAMKAARKPALTQEYAKCILFDYSYKYFYRDGYGKDYHILNLNDDMQEEIRQLYLTACLLVFYQQLRLYREQHAAYTPYLIEPPLWVFVGGSVTKTTSNKDVSDIVDILLFLSDFVEYGNRQAVLGRIERLLNGTAGLRDRAGREIFGNSFAYLLSTGKTADGIFAHILQLVFNAAAPAKLHVEHLKGSDGEIALQLGENEPFGVINVGDPKKLTDLCAEHDLMVTNDRDFAGSLFVRINDADSPIKLLIGSKKFSEGWNSWRVSTMGLMNVGQSEGSQIIQLFGRGVRLKGYGFGLKRSRKVQEEQRVPVPKRIETLETLNIFGIRADYMSQFKEYLEDEGLPANEHRLEFMLPVVKHLGNINKLRVIRVKPGIDFKKHGPKPTLSSVDHTAKLAPVSVDWYPKIQTQRSKDIAANADVALKNEAELTAQHIAFMDLDAIFFELEQLKNERAWHNLNLSRAEIATLLATPDWYKLYIPSEEMGFTSFAKIRVWQEIAVALLKKYCDKYYKYRKSAYELPHLEYQTLSEGDPNLIDEYRFLIDESQEAIIQTLQTLKAEIDAGKLRDSAVGNFQTISFGQHLYEPLIYLKSDYVEVKPVELNEGERDFVVDLRTFYTKRPDFFAGKELYLLRNQSQRGIGFFEAGNFYPDFILWLLTDNRQYITFVDPKGIRNLASIDDPKIAFSKRIKELEQRLGDPVVALNSFIIANTLHSNVAHWRDETGQLMDRATFEQRHVFFQKEDKATYIGKLLDAVLKG